MTSRMAACWEQECKKVSPRPNKLIRKIRVAYEVQWDQRYEIDSRHSSVQWQAACLNRRRRSCRSKEDQQEEVSRVLRRHKGLRHHWGSFDSLARSSYLAFREGWWNDPTRQTYRGPSRGGADGLSLVMGEPAFVTAGEGVRAGFGADFSCAQSAESKYFLSPPFSRLASNPFCVGRPPYLAFSCKEGGGEGRERGR